MRGQLPLSAHTSQQWLIDQIASEFTVHDVWLLDTPGDLDELPLLVSLAREPHPVQAITDEL